MAIEVISDDPKAPFGLDGNGVPITPYGTKVNGEPRISNRGAKPGMRGNGGKKAISAAASNTDKKRKEMLVGLADMLIVTPLAGASLSPFLTKRLGERHTDALAGDAVIVSSFAPHLADGLIVLGQSKPGALAWLDTVEEKAPYLMLMQVGLQMTKAFVGNHMNPDARLANAGRTLASMKAAEMAEEIERQAAELGVPTGVDHGSAQAA